MAEQPKQPVRSSFRIPSSIEDAGARDEELKRAVREIEAQLGDTERRRAASVSPEAFQCYEAWRGKTLWCLRKRHKEREFLSYWKREVFSRSQWSPSEVAMETEPQDFTTLFGPREVHPTTLEEAMALRREVAARLRQVEGELGQLRGGRRLDVATGAYMGETEFHHRRSGALRQVARLRAQLKYLRQWIDCRRTTWSTAPVAVNADDPVGLLRACFQLLESSLRGNAVPDRQQVAPVLGAIRTYLSRQP